MTVSKFVLAAALGLTALTTTASAYDARQAEIDRREAMQEQRQQLMPVSSVRAPSPPIPVAAPRPAPVATPSSGPIPPMPVRAAPQVPALLPPEPMRADRPIAGPSGPRLQWAPAGSLGMNGGLPVGFPE